MKKYTPYILPLVILSIVFFLVFRWYNARTNQAKPDLFGEGVQIENLSEDELRNTLSESADLEKVDLKQVEEAQKAEGATGRSEELKSAVLTGSIRYEYQDGRVRFSVIASLPEDVKDEGQYNVWLHQPDTDGHDTDKFVFNLTKQKGGFLGTASIPTDQLPVTVLVARGTELAVGDVLLEGTIEPQDAE